VLQVIEGRETEREGGRERERERGSWNLPDIAGKGERVSTAVTFDRA